VDTGAIKNPLVTKSIESKFPDTLKKEWLVYATERKRSGTTQNRFDCLLTFLKEQESIYEQLEQLREEEPCRKEAKADPRHARTKSTKMTITSTYVPTPMPGEAKKVRIKADLVQREIKTGGDVQRTKKTSSTSYLRSWLNSVGMCSQILHQEPSALGKIS